MCLDIDTNPIAIHLKQVVVQEKLSFHVISALDEDLVFLVVFPQLGICQRMEYVGEFV